MNFDFQFFLTAILLGAGLAMDAFSVSLANGLNSPCMKVSKMSFVAGLFAVFQALMPLIGWVCVHTVVETFSAFEKFIPWIALGLLSFIGGKMLIEGLRPCEGEACLCKKLTVGTLLIQGLATSIDALSVGFTISDYLLPAALISVAIIGLVTFMICLVGLEIGKRFGTKLAGKASIFGGVILIAIGIEIFITGLIG